MEVNRINSARIVQCLMGEKKSLSLYTIGFSYYAVMYFGFEEVWQELENTGSWVAEYPCSSSSPSYEERISKLSTLLNMDYLHRTERLKADISRLYSTNPDIARLVINELQIMRIKDDIKSCIRENPHKLLAHVWVLYSALFNGGRFIRRRIVKAGTDFWGLTTEDEDIKSFPAPLSFWSVSDDPSFLERFKNRVNRADKLLTVTERKDVVDESVWIICKCKQLTEDLDKRTKLYSENSILPSAQITLPFS
ncbi:biliverdin-producing heme oxygenase [Aspergillus alliaceus]|uniref:biliverdin-producing heme oxygenase n=1 Tax=Petromyces alliaceus TaxID=209559 RepID=UPI0012A420B0|nr:heme-binding peroxidase [Aspergillus alliaceus]KAB8227893.1 heme-binding peroxidase [Aspergillus alliaceus]